MFFMFFYSKVNVFIIYAYNYKVLRSYKNKNVKCVLYSSKCTKMRLSVGLRQDPLKEFSQLTYRPPSWSGLWGRTRGNRQRREKEGMHSRLFACTPTDPFNLLVRNIKLKNT